MPGVRLQRQRRLRNASRRHKIHTGRALVAGRCAVVNRSRGRRRRRRRVSLMRFTLIEIITVAANAVMTHGANASTQSSRLHNTDGGGGGVE